MWPALVNEVRDTMADLLKKYLTADRIVHLDERERFAAISAMNELLTDRAGCSRTIADQIVEREHVLSTAVGNHIAVPHAKGDDIEGINLAMGVSQAGIDWNALDDKPVHLVFIVTASHEQNRDYLHLLADIVRNFNDVELVQRLAAIGDEVELRQQVLNLIGA